MNNWSTSKLGDIVKSGGGKIHTGPFGSQLHASDYMPSGIPCIMPANMKDNRVDLSKISFIAEHDAQRLSKYLVQGGDIVYSRRGDVTLKALIRNEEAGYFCGTGCLLLRPGNEIDPEFLTYYLSTTTMKDWIKKQAVGATMPNINTDILSNIPFTGPEKQKQKQIVSVMYSIDNKISLNNKINAELEAMAKLIYDYWFVQFDFPDANDKPYKSSGGKMVYNEALKREIPEDWEVGYLSDWIHSDKTGDWGKESEQGSYTLQVDCIRGADINGLNGKGKVKTPNRFILQKNHHKLLRPFDLVVEISGGSPTQSTGRMAYLIAETFKRFEHPLICSNFCKVISLVNNDCFYNFVYQWNAIYDKGILFGWEGKTSGIKNLLFDSFVNKHSVCFPPQLLAKKFSLLIEPIQKKKQIVLKENSELESLRDWLLPMLMNGQVTVKDA